MAKKHEIRLIAQDFSKIIVCGEDYAKWEDLYNGAGAVIGDEPEQFTEDDTVVGQIETDLEYAEVVEIMIDEAFLGEKLASALRSKESKVIL